MTARPEQFEPAGTPVAPAPVWPRFDAEQIAAVTRVLESGRVNAWTGPEVGRFEEGFARFVGCEHAVAVANGSVSLTLALEALGLAPGDEVIVTPRSFVISASAVVLAGGTPVFADVDPESQNITPETIAPLIGPRTKGIIPVHLGGWPCDMAGIMALAGSHGLWVIEDCAQAHGGRVQGRHVGSFGTLGSFSFCQDKIMSTGGEGGMLVTADPELWRRLWSLKDHGKDYDEVHSPGEGGFRWLHGGIGTNLRLPGPAAALGLVQLERMPDWTARRTANAAVLADCFDALPALRVPLPGAGLQHAWYRFYAFLRPEALKDGWTRDRIVAEVAERGETIFSGSCPEIYREGLFAARGLGPADRLPVARALGETSLAFRVDPTLGPAEMAKLAGTVTEVVTQATR